MMALTQRALVFRKSRGPLLLSASIREIRIPDPFFLSAVMKVPFFQGH
jgi:hypothetical protein